MKNNNYPMNASTSSITPPSSSTSYFSLHTFILIIPKRIFVTIILLLSCVSFWWGQHHHNNHALAFTPSSIPLVRSSSSTTTSSSQHFLSVSSSTLAQGTTRFTINGRSTSSSSTRLFVLEKPRITIQEGQEEEEEEEGNGSLNGGRGKGDASMAEKATIISSTDDDTEQQQQLRTWFRDTIFLGIDPTPDVVAIATIYFVEGALGLARLAQTFLLKDELHLGPAELSALTGLFTLPWTIKPLYGFLSDGFPLFGYRRRSYLILAGVLGCISYTMVGHNFWNMLGGTTTTDSSMLIPATVAALIVSSGCIAFSDVVADGIVVQKTRESSDPKIAGGLQSLCWGSAAIGGLLSAYFSGSLLEVMKPQDIFQLTAILPFMVACIALLIDEKPIRNDVATTTEDTMEGVRQQMDSLWEAVKQPSIYKPALFIFLWQSTPTSDGAFLYFMTDDLGFGPEFLGRVRLVASAASLFGVWLYNSYLKTKSIKDILLWSSILSFPLGMSSLLLITHANRVLGIPDGAFVFGDDVALSILGEIAFLPTLVLAARLCPPGVEAVLFATLMSVNNAASTLGTEIGALLTKWMGVTETNFDNLGMLTIICNLASLYPLFFIGWLDEVGDMSEDEIEREQELQQQQQQEQQLLATSQVSEE